jgi:hypothetical protein
MLRFGDHALAGGGAVIDDAASRLSRPALAVSILIHVAVLVAASRFAWQRADVDPVVRTTEYVWLGELAPPQPPVELAPPAEPAPAEAQAPVPTPATRPTSPPRPAATTEAPPAVAPPEPAAPVDTPAPARAAPTRLDLDTARHEAAAAVVEQHARDGKVLRFSLDDAVPPRPVREPKKPSIFDPGLSSGSGVLSPGKARTAAGFKLRSWCNRITGGGFGFFGIPVCTSPGIEPPSGLFVESIPEYMKLKPDCEETRPFAAALGEASEYPTVKCRLVPKDPDD